MTASQDVRKRFRALLLAAGMGLLPGLAGATIIGWVQTSSVATFDLMATADTISTGDGDSVWMWGYAQCAGAASCQRMQYPGPTLIVNQGAVVTIVLRNQLPVPTSIVFPGQNVSIVSGGVPGLLTNEIAAASPGTTTTTPVVYRFTASKPGTYAYYSGTRPDLQVEMGLIGAIIVRPTGYSASAPRAYNDISTAYDREYLFLLSELDPGIHSQVAQATSASNSLAVIQPLLGAVDMSRRDAVDWFINGRNFPDTVAPPNPPAGQTGFPGGLPVAAWLPTQPYNIFPQMYPGERVLIRWVSGGLDLHPFHTHGQNHLVIARDGRVLSTALSTSASPPADLAVSDYTTTAVPGETVDAIWGPWTGEKLGWDVYGHTGAGCGPGTSGRGRICRRSLQALPGRTSGREQRHVRQFLRRLSIPRRPGSAAAAEPGRHRPRPAKPAGRPGVHVALPQ